MNLKYLRKLRRRLVKFPELQTPGRVAGFERELSRLTPRQASRVMALPPRPQVESTFQWSPPKGRWRGDGHDLERIARAEAKRALLHPGRAGSSHAGSELAGRIAPPPGTLR